MNMSQLRNILQQDFYYISESSRCYVYSSADDQYVLKLFKSPKELRAQFERWGIDLGQVDWSPVPGNALRSAEMLYTYTQSSCRLAYRKLKEETGLIYIHLDKTQQIRIKTRVNHKLMALDAKQFILQYKVPLLEQIITQYLKEKRIAGAKLLLLKLVSFIDHLWSMDISEDTFNFHDNYGVSPEGSIIQVDVGEFHKGVEHVRLERARQNILKKESYTWLLNQSPELARYLAKIAKTQLFTV